MGVNKFIFFICFLFLSVLTNGLLYGQSLDFDGRVLDSLERPIQNANILLREAKESGKIQFKTSDANGQFSFAVIPETTYEIRITYIGYNTINEELKVEKTPISRAYRLKDALEQLGEVVITRKPDIIHKKDTVVYNPDAFTKGGERNVEDLLRQLPGIRVDREGSIFVGDQEIEKILIDNDDFLGKRYKLISKNLRIEAIDSIQVISDYQDNHLLKGVVESNKTAINLQLKEAYRQIWFGNIDAGYDVAGEDYHALKVNIMKLDERMKHYFIGDFNNKGMSSSGNQIVIDASDIDGFGGVASGESLSYYNSPSGFNLNMNAHRYDNNKHKLGSYNNILPFSQQTKLTTNILGQWNDKNYYNESTVAYRDGLDFTNTRSQDLFAKAFSGEIKTRLDSYLSSKESISVEVNYHRNTDDASRFNVFNDEEIHEKYKNTKQRLDITGNYLNKLSPKTIWLVNSRFINMSKPELYDVDKFLYSELFHGIEGEAIQQDLYNTMEVYAVSSNLRTRQNDNLSYRLDAEYLYRKDRLKTRISIPQRQGLPAWMSELNNQNFTRADFYLSGGMRLRISRFRFNLGLKANHLQTTLQEVDFEGKKTQNTYLEPQLSLRYKLGEKQGINLSYTKRFQSTNPYLLNRNPIVQGLQMVSKGFSAFDQISSESYEAGYTYGKWNDVFNFDFTMRYNVDHDYFTSKMQIEQDYTYVEHIKSQNQKRFSLDTNGQYYIDGLTSNLKLGVNYSMLDYQIQRNSDVWEDVESQYWSVTPSFTSAFSGFFNYDVSGTYSYSLSKTETSASSSYLKASATMYFNINKKFSFNMHFDTYQFFDSSIRATDFVDLSMSYKATLLSKEFHFVLEGRNLLNNNSFNQSRVSDISRSNEQYQLLPRMLMLNVNWSF